jgi:hypothetical protein
LHYFSEVTTYIDLKPSVAIKKACAKLVIEIDMEVSKLGLDDGDTTVAIPSKLSCLYLAIEYVYSCTA